MKDKIRSTIERYSMLHSGDTVAVCLSGGADSMALFHFLFSTKEELCIEVLALHVNHGLREESRREEEFVRGYCASLGAECVVERLDMNSRPKPAGLSVESWARHLRSEFFYREAGKRNCLLKIPGMK